MVGGDCWGFLFMDYPHGSRKYRRFIRFRQMRVGQQRALSWDTLREGGEEVRARGLIMENTPSDRMFLEAVVPSYRTMMVEFLPTFLFRPWPADQPNSDMDDLNVEPPPPEVSFCLFGERQNMSLRRLLLPPDSIPKMSWFRNLYHREHSYAG
ncbi:hypothetical protein HanXRQr2_Chr03g0108951 [Helianthus annuus]|uniref:Uncharacterized protein n=1 Tax=Helianthus annuus TaxID=4232 RepID=A0A9K3NVL6_HELAN|nr:hypothetical protein HanXRQr2_Chr03g0108951 [Helianthus annuus]KAJ0943504.1 hypothetical protein HanPSC8_Chr03g0105521 [Helianthus annuus]